MSTNLEQNQEAIEKFTKFLYDYESQETITDAEVVKTIATNRDIILDMAFSDDNDPIHMKAFVLLCNISPALRQEFLKQDRIFIKITKVLQNKPVPDILISRIATVLQSFIFGIPKSSTDSLGLLVFFIPYLEFQTVFDLFSSITSPSFQIPQFTEVLSNLKFDQTLLNELKNNPSPSKKGHIFYIIRNCCKNTSFLDKFRTQVVIDTLNDQIPCEDDYSNGNLWQAISAICEENTFQMMEAILEKSFKVLSEPVLQIHMAHTCMWDFVGKMLIFKKDPNFGGNYQLHHQIITLLVQFPNNSNLIGALFRFIRNGLQVKGYAKKIIEDFIPFMVTTIEEDEKNTASASCRMFVGDMTVLRRIHPEVNKALKNIEIFNNIKEKFVDKYFETLSEEYGGHAPPPQNNGVITLQCLMHLTD
ncbi:hypothetical protein M9Y10_016844 [Tritrichomonas musculus]|uniref:Uncharacterized protein n=1 Tax=Tritrichomonas musculus TaxID=1915356 RepID=A0ABR2HXF7_9EUKA